MTSSWKLTLNNAEDQQESWLKKLLSLLYKLLGYSLPLWKYSVRKLWGSVWGIFLLLLLLVASFSFLEFSILWFFICLFKFVVLAQEWISYIYRLQFTLFSFAAIEYLLFFSAIVLSHTPESHDSMATRHGRAGEEVTSNMCMQDVREAAFVQTCLLFDGTGAMYWTQRGETNKGIDPFTRINQLVLILSIFGSIHS